jgi:hypothetical protein
MDVAGIRLQPPKVMATKATRTGTILYPFLLIDDDLKKKNLEEIKKTTA